MLAGILLFHADRWTPSVWTPAGLAAVLFGCRLLIPGRAGARLLLLIGAWAAVGFGAAALELARTDTTILSGDATVRIDGTVTRREADERGRFRYTIDVASTDRPVLSRPPERVRILVSSRHAPLPIGGRYVGLVRLRPPAGPAYPGAYDFAFAPYFDGLGAYGFSLGAPEARSEVRPPTFADGVARLRMSMDEKIRSVLPGATGAVASALITGERAGIPDDIEDALRATSLAHILSISGFHMALVAGFTMFVVRAALAGFPAVALRFPVRKFAAVAALAVSFFYFVLAGDNPATERSFVMIAIMLGAILCDRPALTLRNVGVAALIVMLLAPHVVLTATFQMSFAATVALVGAYGAYSSWRHRRERTIGPASRARWRTILVVLAGVTLSSLIAGAATAPYGIYHFKRVAPFGLIANVLATPILSFWVMPLALASALAMPLGLEALFLQPMGWGLDLVFRFARDFATLLPDQAVGRMSGVALVLLTIAILVLSFSASLLRWAAVPIAALGLAFLSPGPPPEILVFESGTEAAVVLPDGKAAALKPKPAAFVWDQWARAYGWTSTVSPTITTSGEPASAPGSSASPSSLAATGFACLDDVCRIVSPSGWRVAWTNAYEKLGDLCDTADLVIVARAMRTNSCRSGARLLTLRSLRRTGSVAVYARTPRQTHPRIVAAVPNDRPAWNVHRTMPWPEFWRKPASGEAPGTPSAPDGSPTSTQTPNDDAAAAPPMPTATSGDPNTNGSDEAGQ
ncbi:ComEC/Rec2 family competence protein [Aureimonas pseudogalii]|uniref:ComEC/Rec2 family competence protein n=1 Tax=Aureimonas pseudogalii TaxID=1744844 RepID=UPI001605DCB4